eukprot:c23471_g1_i1 orf=292-975(+)
MNALLNAPLTVQPNNFYDSQHVAHVREPEKRTSLANCKLETLQEEEAHDFNTKFASKLPRFSSAGIHTTHLELNESSYPLDQQSLAYLLQKETHLYKGHHLHDHIVKIGLNHDLFFENMTLNMYGRCGALNDAHYIFLGMPKDDAASWNAMISVYAQHGHDRDAIHLFMEMRRQSVVLTRVTFMSVLNACDHPAALMEGVKIHAIMVESGYEGSELLGTALVSMYGK